MQNERETDKGLSTNIDGYVIMSTPNGTAHLPNCNDCRTVNVHSRQGCDQNVHEMVEVLCAHTDSYSSKCPSDSTTRLLNSVDRKPINEDPLADSRQGCDQNVHEMDEVVSTDADSCSQKCTSKSTAWRLDSDDHTPAIANNGRQFPCVVCNKLVHVYRMKRHVRTHTDDRPYCCDVCGRRFLESRHLVEHARTHSGDRPFACYVCSQQFGRAGNQRCSSYKNNSDVMKFEFN